MKKYILFFSVFWIISCTKSYIQVQPSNTDALFYVVDLDKRFDDTFNVTLFVNNLTENNDIFQFAASAPGTYRTMDMGRFVRKFYAFNALNDTLKTEHISVNQWKLENPAGVSRIEYEIAETWDTRVDSNSVYVMCGTSLEKDHALINGQAVFGFPKGMQQRPVEISINYPAEWLVGTALARNSNGHFFAENYDQLVDSPILLGRLTKSDTDVDGTKIEVYSYSQNDVIKADEILNSVEDILNASDKFIGGLPVKRYTFLFHFENKDLYGAGAWEHNYSSFYAFNETPIDVMLNHGLASTMAHEFFHIITPLHIHSELVEQFNFIKPQPSEHLWLYEGTTEWASKIMQLRGGLITLDDYLSDLSKKLKGSDHYRKDYSLTELSLNSFSVKGQNEYGNIYMRGAVTAGLLDIRLLELSEGKRGLREVIKQLMNIYGIHKSFDEKTFFETFTKMTYPEIGDFIDNYIRSSQPLPIKDYYDKIGIKYIPSLNTGKIDTVAGLAMIGDSDNHLVLDNLSDKVKAMGPMDGDILLDVNNQAISMKTIWKIFKELDSLTLDDPYTIKVLRAGEEKSFTLKKITREKTEKHIFEIEQDINPVQAKLRDAWLRNL